MFFVDVDIYIYAVHMYWWPSIQAFSPPPPLGSEKRVQSVPSVSSYLAATR